MAHFFCMQCGWRIDVDDNFSGAQMTCPGCQGAVEVPQSLPHVAPGRAPAAPPPMPNPPMQPKLVDDEGMRLLLPVGRSGWAIAAGYLGLLSVMLLPAPFAIICSVIALRDLKKRKAAGQPKHGLGRAIFGLVMGVMGVLVTVLVAFELLFGG